MIAVAQPLWTDAAQAVPIVLGYGWFAASSVALAVIDVRTHRLPDRIVLPGYAVGVACLLPPSVLGVPWARFLGALIAMVGLFVFFLVLRILSRRGIGGGDVKLAGVVGLHLGWFGITAVLAGLIAAFLIGGIVALVLLVSRKATRTTAIAFGPFLLAGAWIGVALALAAPG